MKDLAIAGTYGRAEYTTGLYVTPATEGDFFKGLGIIIMGIVLSAIVYMFWANRK